MESMSTNGARNMAPAIASGRLKSGDCKVSSVPQYLMQTTAPGPAVWMGWCQTYVRKAIVCVARSVLQKAERTIKGAQAWMAGTRSAYMTDAPWVANTLKGKHPSHEC